MTTQQLALFAILGGLLVLLAWGRWRYDVVAFAALIAAVVAGVVPAGEAFSGFGHPATVTVAAVLIISRALTGSGATDWLARLLQPAVARTATHVAALSAVGALLSSFMNNVGALGLLMPVAMQSARKAKRPVSAILMPLSYGSILGGLVTLIGTPPNIIVANYRGQVGEAPFGMFAFTPVGGVVAVAGVAFIALVGWRLVPKRGTAGGQGAEAFDIGDYLAEVKVPENSPVIGKTVTELTGELGDIEVQMLGVVPGRLRFITIPQHLRLEPGDVLTVEASPEELDRFISALGLKLMGATEEAATQAAARDDAPPGGGKAGGEKPGGEKPGGEGLELLEVVVAPRSRLEGRSAEELRLPQRFGVKLLGVSRQGQRHRGRLKAFRFHLGDVLLLHGEADHLAEVVTRLGCLPLAGRQFSFGRRGHARPIIALFAAAIALASFGLLPMPIALALSVTVMTLAGLIPLRDLYEGVDWPVIVLLGALIPVGGALETTGATTLIADFILAVTAGLPPAAVLVLVLVVTMTLSDILNNAATAVVMAPIAMSLADRLGVASDPFLMAVAVGASCAFLTPIGHQNNALIMGPGGYHFGDYWRLGLPLEILIVTVATPMILLVWPL